MAVLLLIDTYIYRGIVASLPKSFLHLKGTIRLIYWSVPVIVFFWLIYLFSQGAFSDNQFPRFMYLVGFIMLFYLPKLLFAGFQLISDLFQISMWLWTKISSESQGSGLGISRSRFLLQIGVLASAIPFFGVAHGVIWGRFNFRVIRHKLTFSNFPKVFNGFRVLQISDAHLGSFIGSEEKIKGAVELINEQEADIVVFTGDIVNSFPSELKTFVDVFAGIKAKEGKYAILGNHDYGFHGPRPENHNPNSNIKELQSAYKQMGFQLLMNENVTFSKGGEQFSLLGVENWGRPPFPQFGDIEKAKQGTENSKFTILLSHDPSHWEEEIRTKTAIDLTLSGHTHGMQFGIKVGNWQWSPVSMKYKRWGGLYQEGKQYLHVNRGFGVLAFPGRIGMDPELTVIDFYNS